MPADLEFLLGLLERDEHACVAQEDFDGPHGKALRLWQRMGFLDTEPGMNPVPSCPHCGEGAPYRIGGRLLCNHCRSTVDPKHLLLWRMNLEAFLRWVAQHLKLRGDLRWIDSSLWQLGTHVAKGIPFECFYRRAILTEFARSRLATYRNTLLLYGISRPENGDGTHGPSLSLLEMLECGRNLRVVRGVSLVHTRGEVRFDADSGVLWAADVQLGEVPVGSREYFFLAYLAAHLDRYVPYADLKHYVLQRAGSTDTTEEATFCQNLKRRLKKHIPQMDRLLTTTNKGDGYRLRGHAEP